MKVYSLSIHADYRCRHSGICCTTRWDVPVELTVYGPLAEALRTDRVQPVSILDDGPLVVDPDLPKGIGAILARTNTNECVFFHRGSHLCAIHRDLGEAALPSTCRLFPRVALSDARGTSITLSHFCPTAAAMLFRDDGVTLSIVENPFAFPPAEYEGLSVDAESLPPLLRPRMLMDVDGYAAWERHMVERCADATRSPDAVVATLTRDARALHEWTPGDIALADAVAELPHEPLNARPPDGIESSLQLRNEVVAAVPDALKPPPDEVGLEMAYALWVDAGWDRFRVPVNRYLASRAFASWAAYQGQGLLTQVRGLASALAVLRVEASRQCRDAGRVLDASLLREAFRRADFLLHHLADSQRLAERWSAAENG